MSTLEKCVYCGADLTPDERRKAACSHCGATLPSDARDRAVAEALQRGRDARAYFAESGKTPSDDAHENARTLDRAETRRKTPTATVPPKPATEPKKESADAVSPT